MEPEKWQRLNIFEQLGNIGSEVSRAKYWQDKGDIDKRNSSLERSFDLLDLTSADKKNISRLGEIGRLKEVLADLYGQTGCYQVSLGEVEKLLFDFAARARA